LKILVHPDLTTHMIDDHCALTHVKLWYFRSGQMIIDLNAVDLPSTRDHFESMVAKTSNNGCSNTCRASRHQGNASWPTLHLLHWT